MRKMKISPYIHAFCVTVRFNPRSPLLRHVPYVWAFTHPAWSLPGGSKYRHDHFHREVRYDY
jgi:hypothetical protein